MMKSYPLSQGDRIPALGLGTWKSAPDQVYQAVKEALTLGYQHIDCAAIYRNEAEIGRAFTETLATGQIKREDLWITSKLWNNAHKQDQVIPALKQTLSDLNLDYLDLYLIHWPVALKETVLLPDTGADFYSLEEVPLLETWLGMEEAKKEGLCRHIGVSNFSQTKLDQLLKNAADKPEVNQVECHPYFSQTDLLNYCQSNNVLLTAYSPLGSGDRPDAFKKEDEPVLLNHPLLKEIGEKYQASPAQILLAWAIGRETVVIPKSVNPTRLKENLAAAEITLSSEDLSKITQLDRHYRYVDGEFWTRDGSPYTLSNLWDE
ncbi:MAG: aldo/keto reductase [Microcystaceae cyanobacterium]